MPNRLADAASLYLRQHADNPVDWFPWGEDAWETARREDKPVLISIGYSACHWCHVMAHESFDSEYIARLMNEHFVCIKVDREERPDVDRLYMEVVQMINGHGGWPLNVFCLPDGRPFAGGTYFPPTDNGRGIVPWPQLLMRISEAYKRQRSDLEENAHAIAHNLGLGNQPFAPAAAKDGEEAAPPTLDGAALVAAGEALAAGHDDTWGGFGRAPKFPPAMALDFLLLLRGSAAVDEAQPTLAARLDQVVRTTLTRMARGGLYDQVGGGFARYCVDNEWQIPHFEKMLYDNGLLLATYSRGWRRYRDPLYADVVAESIDWLDRVMSDADREGFAASLDADSEGVEGKYYVWTPDEVTAVLGPERAPVFCAVYGITTGGNFEHGTSHPRLLTDDPGLRAALADDRAKLLAARQERVSPARDDKRLLGWNALVLRGLAEAAFAFGETSWLARARTLADDLLATFRTPDGRLRTVSYEAGEADLNGYLDDYALLAEALLTLAAYADWQEAGAAAPYRTAARELVDAIEQHFADDEGEPGYYFTSDDHEALVHRQKEWTDNATPAGNSALVQSLAALHALTGEAAYRERLDRLRPAYAEAARRAPYAVAHALAGYTGEALGIAVIKVKGIRDLEPLRSALASQPWRPVHLVVSDDPDQPEGYQLCVGTQCLPPVKEAGEVAGRL